MQQKRKALLHRADSGDSEASANNPRKRRHHDLTAMSPGAATGGGGSDSPLRDGHYSVRQDPNYEVRTPRIKSFSLKHSSFQSLGY